MWFVALNNLGRPSQQFCGVSSPGQLRVRNPMDEVLTIDSERFGTGRLRCEQRRAGACKGVEYAVAL